MEFNATFIVAAISFVVFTLIMNKILYQPISDIMLKRQKYLDENSSAAKNNVEKAEALRLNRNEKISEAKSLAGKKVTEQVFDLKAQKLQKEAELRNEFNKNVEESKQEILKETEQARNVLENEVGNISEAILSKLAGGLE